MGGTPPSLYAAFASKDELYSAALDRYKASCGGYAAHALTEEPRVKEAVACMLREAEAVYTASRESLGCMLAAGAVMRAPEHKDVIADLTRQRGSVTAMVKDSLTERSPKGNSLRQPIRSRSRPITRP